MLGGGTMGGGIAGHLARAGLEVRLADASAELAERAREALLERTRGHVEAGLLADTGVTEAVRAAAGIESAVDGADLVTIVRSTFGFRLPFYGPFQIADMAGLDTYLGVYETLERDVGAAFAPPRELREHVGAGRLGTKAGRGFAEYSDGERERLLLERDRRYAALARLLDET